MWNWVKQRIGANKAGALTGTKDAWSQLITCYCSSRAIVEVWTRKELLRSYKVQCPGWYSYWLFLLSWGFTFSKLVVPPPFPADGKWFENNSIGWLWGGPPWCTAGNRCRLCRTPCGTRRPYSGISSVVVAPKSKIFLSFMRKAYRSSWEHAVLPVRRERISWA